MSVSLLPDRSECLYASCYCEENVYKLVKHVEKCSPESLNHVWTVFISNNEKCVPLWQQKAGRDEDGLVTWDYHVGVATKTMSILWMNFILTQSTNILF